MILPDPPLLVITDARGTRSPVVDIVAEACAGGCRWVMVREKNLPRNELEELVMACRAAMCGTGATISVNTDTKVAVDCGVGVHLPRHGDIAEARQRVSGIIGISAHDQGEVLRARARGADYVTLSPVFKSPSKPGYGPVLGLSGLRRFAGADNLPIIALGGVDAGNAGDCVTVGAAGVAVMGAVMRARDPRWASAALVAAIASSAVASRTASP